MSPWEHRLFLPLEGIPLVQEKVTKPVVVSFGSSDLKWPLTRFSRQVRQSGHFSRLMLFSEENLDLRFRTEFAHLLSPEVRGFGYWLWKPQVIAQALEAVPDGTPVAYIDLGCHIVRDPGFEWAPLIALAKSSATSVVCFQDDSRDPALKSGSLERAWTKRDTLEFFGVGENADITETPQIAATSLFLVASPQSRSFVAEWLSSCSDNIQMLDDSPSAGAESPFFVEHRFDQSVLSILTKLRGGTVLPLGLLYGVTVSLERGRTLALPWIAMRDKGGRVSSALIGGREVMRRARRRLARYRFCS